MKLIICEKPSLAKTVAQAIGINKFEKGYYVCKNNFIVSYVFGHILKLKEFRDYPENLNKPWKAYSLPFLPDTFVYEIPNEPQKKEQLKILKKLSKETSCIIHCGDADREGQIIIDNVINYIGYKGHVKRLWLPEQTEETILKQLKEMKDNKEYSLLSLEGQARTYLDWIYGMNLSIYLTLAANEKFNVGRVLTPITKFIFDREQEIKNFIPTPYYTVEAKFGDLSLKVKEKFKDIENAHKKMNELNQHIAQVIDIQETHKKYNPKKLFSLSVLQSELSKKSKITFAQSLKIIQGLYEKGYLTYPRTNTEYLSVAEFERINSILIQLNNDGYNLQNKNTKKIYDDSKIESHSAITITTKKPENLNDLEKTVYRTVFNRFLSNFYQEECIIAEKIIKIQINHEEFLLKGKTIIQEGFLKYEPMSFEDKLPLCKIGDTFTCQFETLSKTTEPPKPMSEGELSALLKNPFRKNKNVLDPEDEDTSFTNEESYDTEEYQAMLKGLEIGTEATRTPTIEKLIQLNYIKQEKDKYFITEKGEKFIFLVEKFKIPLLIEKSLELSVALKNIYLGKKTIEEVLSYAKKELEKICSTSAIPTFSSHQSIGQCICCESGNILDGQFSYFCQEKCGFKIPKKILNCIIEKKDAADLLQNQKTEKIFHFIPKEKKQDFKARLILKKDFSIGFESLKN